MQKQKPRPILEEPIFYGAPLSHVRSYFQNWVKKYRKDNPEFDEYLNETYLAIKAKKLDYCGNILQLLEGNGLPNWIAPHKSLFRFLIESFNDDFTAKDFVEYVEYCYKHYLYLLNDELKLSKHHEIYLKPNRWDGTLKEFVHTSLVPVKQPKQFSDWYYLDINFGSLQERRQDIDLLCNANIKIVSKFSKYDDALILFDRYQGCKYLNKVYKTAIKEMRKHKIIEGGPIKMDYGHSIVDYYKIKIK